MSEIKLYNGDCLQVMDKLIADGIKVDAIITDPPYGTTACKWDSVIPFDKMWLRINNLIKDNGAVVLFGNEPFSSLLRTSNLMGYKYDWKWIKPNSTTPNIANKQPMRRYEDVMIFGTTIYYPQMRTGIPYEWRARRSGGVAGGIQYKYDRQIINTGTRYPTNVIEFSQERGFHPTQKPVDLIKYLVKTYTKENETVLDFTMGSGTTGVACKLLNRNFIGIELDENYFKIAEERINNTIVRKGLF